MPLNSSALSQSSATIALVDDSDLVRELLCELLEEQGYQVMEFSSGSAALAAFTMLTPDLILLDVEMPDMDGFEVCARLKELPKLVDIPVIFISSYAATEDKVKAFECGGVDYITKPIAMAEVTARIKNHLKLRQYQAQLTEKNQVLTQALAELKSAQSHLVQSEKMASLGQLVAGVAHEINNPVSVVFGNVHIMRRNMHRLQQYIDCLHKEGLGPHQQQLRQQLHIDHLLKDLVPLVSNTLEATERTRDIVADLRTFSSSNTSDKSEINLTQAVDTALRWVIKGKKITVDRQLPSHLPIIGHLGQLTQVMINLLQNALDATNDVTTPTLKIRGGELDGKIWFSIADNGSGISNSDLETIFDPFFTTKPVGQGTGLGLSISYSLVAEHNGELKVENIKQGGARFTIELPMVPQV